MDEKDFKKKLNPEEYKVLRQKGTEAPFSGKYWKPGAKGMFKCKACGNELFSADTQFETKLPGLQGWPSFEQAIPGSIRMQADDSGGMHRTEVVCNRCGSHLGHLFDDQSETKTGKHYCVNSTCLELENNSKAGAIVDKAKEVAENVELPEKEEREDGESRKGDGGPNWKNILSALVVGVIGVGIGTVSGRALCQETNISETLLNIPSFIQSASPAPAPTPTPTPPRNPGASVPASSQSQQIEAVPLPGPIPGFPPPAGGGSVDGSASSPQGGTVTP